MALSLRRSVHPGSPVLCQNLKRDRLLGRSYRYIKYVLTEAQIKCILQVSTYSGGPLTISAKELRGKPTQIIEQASRGTEVIITLHGKKAARLVPYNSSSHGENELEDEIFGLWENREMQTDPEAYVRGLRKGRTF